MAEWVFIT
jgi:hypothetical protein